jgi:hypothetical protein
MITGEPFFFRQLCWKERFAGSFSCFVSDFVAMKRNHWNNIKGNFSIVPVAGIRISNLFLLLGAVKASQ